MLTLPLDMVETIRHQAQAHDPIECCGIITADKRSGLPARLIPMGNAAQSKVFFEFVPLQQLHIWQEMEARGERLLVIYHSHTASRPYPSPEDVAYAQSFPEGALEGTQINAGHGAGWLQPRASNMGAMNVSGKCLAIFEADHSSSPFPWLKHGYVWGGESYPSKLPSANAGLSLSTPRATLMAALPEPMSRPLVC